jgi:putative sigma-54 modulation protein
MELLVRNADGNLTQRDRDYAAKKLGKLERYFHAAQKVEMVHHEGKLDHKIEVTVFVDGMTLRGEETDGTVQAAIDKVADKLENRLRRLKSRIIKSHRHKGRPIPNGLEENHAEPAGHEPAIVEFKRFRLKPMTVEDAGLQLEMLGHPFFVFLNSESGQTEVIYKREDGDFGLIAPDL